MPKIIILTGLMLLFISCNQSSECQNQETSQNSQESSTASSGCEAPASEPDEAEPTVTDEDPVLEEPAEDNGDVPNEAITFDASVKLFEFEKEDEEKVLKAIEIIKKVVASREFQEKVLNFTYQGKKQFVDSDGKSNAQIYQSLLDGSEELKPQDDNQMDLELQLYYSWRSTVGYTTPGELRIYMNTKFFDYYTPAEVAGNVFHEWTHKLGYGHDSSYSVSRDSSVPYAIGNIIEELGKQYE